MSRGVKFVSFDDVSAFWRKCVCVAACPAVHPNCSKTFPSHSFIRLAASSPRNAYKYGGCSVCKLQLT